MGVVSRSIDTWESTVNYLVIKNSDIVTVYSYTVLAGGLNIIVVKSYIICRNIKVTIDIESGYTGIKCRFQNIYHEILGWIGQQGPITYEVNWFIQDYLRSVIDSC